MLVRIIEASRTIVKGKLGVASFLVNLNYF
jgi:hypothetical protein